MTGWLFPDCVYVFPQQELFTNPDWPVVLFIGRLTVQKKLDMLINAIGYLKKQGQNCNILFIGDGPARDIIGDSAENVGIHNNIHFYGPAYEEEKLAPLIMLSNVCVSPGEIGLTAIHSLAYGVPVVTHNNFDEQMPEYEAIIDGYNGSFFHQNNVEDLADKIKIWLDVPNTDEVRKRCYEMIDKYYNPEYQVTIINQAVSGVPAQRSCYNI